MAALGCMLVSAQLQAHMCKLHTLLSCGTVVCVATLGCTLVSAQLQAHVFELHTLLSCLLYSSLCGHFGLYTGQCSAASTRVFCILEAESCQGVGDLD